jgi:hypothetical protein
MSGIAPATTAEVRWFCEGTLETRVLSSFRGQREEPRTDRYLIMPGIVSVGVKVRQGRFEVKALKGAPETLTLPKEVSGRSDCWVKWSYGEAPVRALTQALVAEPSGWLDVTKRRWLRKYSLDTGKPTEVSATDRPDEGCNVELTELNVGGNGWWSLGLEAFGDEDRVRTNLRLVGDVFFRSHFDPDSLPIRLTTVSSCSYPVWLPSVQ